MNCPDCNLKCKAHGKDRKGFARFQCTQCKRTFGEARQNLFGGMYVSPEKAAQILGMLVEGCSVSTVERLTGAHHGTILTLLARVGEKLERFLDDRIKDVPVEDVQIDEAWSFIKSKEKNKPVQDDPATGDNWTFVAIERTSKLVLAWHSGRRTSRDTLAFTEKLREATDGRFQLTSDGFGAYPDAVEYSLGMRVDYAKLIKVYGTPRDGEQRYSPAEVISIEVVPVSGNPDPAKICTSHVERQNLTLRMCMRRFTRLTNGFSKKLENHRAAIALHFAHYNFCRRHQTLRMTPAMAAGITDHTWSMRELLEAA
jgi:transposase-like protein/IS1 family transposase